MTDSHVDTAQAHLLGPVQVRELAEELDISPTKKLGQNFVHDPNTVRKIVAASEITASDDVLEIGPGLGSLTLALLETAHTVTAVEIDRRLADKLPETVSTRAEPCAARFHVILKDALKLQRCDFDNAKRPLPSALVANLPYNVSVPVLLHCVEEFKTIRRVLVMVQREVADRLAAEPGSKIYGVPSVKAGYYGNVSRAATIGKNVFWPAPKIDSGLVRIDRWTDQTRPWSLTDLPKGTGESELRAVVFSLADAAFLQRRKTLRAALSSWFSSGSQAEGVLVEAGIDPKQRGEKLSTADFVRLAKVALKNNLVAGEVLR
ncbi:16S rRNA (adenine(1518)-N(6)/adenine(1519)-N(6))-dimethyltransferase RsmA [Corynebacterium anserum]|uniref:Ribosomal RNA small subunit methyltransferase A n=1 Tax=Corynebacterium anserum TaxID=2684406 RepID=A0A7G7YPH2_9CORY|nr:16S rRNA (adenine(1518)-N(6)/adenine(1519)-N(6))-dimethyltransferase RsmA [Corynebacterium anserum]MBC2682020.1 16S rRNA (adenine(1518)-N(6)/adenine(1519)-N(6))-dimethyltransferase RsmA [Corynebacterium anserum]QNH96392.1 16S rRNA (adenine(1518)-N(6)/adenine(1519)-N(6))-dimethyltransferase RsmA [Corynebacterium anserum]